MKPFVSNPGVWDAYTAWINARAAGVVNARAMASGSSSHIYSAIEFNAVRNLTTGLPCDTGANKCVLSMVVPNALVDYYSYSAWQSFLEGLTPGRWRRSSRPISRPRLVGRRRGATCR